MCLILKPLSPNAALKHHFTSLKTFLISLLAGLDINWLDLLARSARQFLGYLPPPPPRQFFTCPTCHWHAVYVLLWQSLKFKMLQIEAIAEGPLSVLFYLPPPEIGCPGQSGDCRALAYNQGYLLQPRVLERKFAWNWFTNTWQFSIIFKPIKSSSSTVKVENFGSNSRLVLDEDEYVEFRLERVLKRWIIFI